MIELLSEELESRITDTIKLLGQSGYYNFLRAAINSKITSRLTISQFNISSAKQAQEITKTLEEWFKEESK